jgi:hypothetical protein
LFNNISKRKKEKKESSCISNADKKTKSRSRINDGFVRWDCVYGGCLFVIFVGFVRWAALVFLRTFLYFIFLDGCLLMLSIGFKIYF